MTKQSAEPSNIREREEIDRSSNRKPAKKHSKYNAVRHGLCFVRKVNAKDESKRKFQPDRIDLCKSSTSPRH